MYFEGVERSSKYNKNEATVSFYVNTDKITQSNYIVDSKTEYSNYIILWLKVFNYNKIWNNTLN